MQSPITPAPRHPSPRRRLPTWSAAAFRASALELMETHHLGWWNCYALARDLTPAGRLAWVEFAVPSAILTTAYYRVWYDASGDLAICGCLTAQRGQPCFHAGVALAYGRRIASSHAPASWPAQAGFVAERA